jgi:hypothetical protein
MSGLKLLDDILFEFLLLLLGRHFLNGLFGCTFTLMCTAFLETRFSDRGEPGYLHFFMVEQEHDFRGHLIKGYPLFIRRGTSLKRTIFEHGLPVDGMTADCVQLAGVDVEDLSPGGLKGPPVGRQGRGQALGGNLQGLGIVPEAQALGLGEHVLGGGLVVRVQLLLQEVGGGHAQPVLFKLGH